MENRWKSVRRYFSAGARGGFNAVSKSFEEFPAFENLVDVLNSI